MNDGARGEAQTFVEGLHSPSIQSPTYEAILQMILFAEDDNGFGCDRFEIWLVLWVGN